MSRGDEEKVAVGCGYLVYGQGSKVVVLWRWWWVMRGVWWSVRNEDVKLVNLSLINVLCEF